MWNKITSLSPHFGLGRAVGFQAAVAANQDWNSLSECSSGLGLLTSEFLDKQLTT